MSIPTKMNKPKLKVGARQNKLPAVLAIGVFSVFIVGVFYAANKRGVETQARLGEHADAETVLEVTDDKLEKIDILQGRPDGLVGISPIVGEEREGKAQRISNIDDRVMSALEEQHLMDINRKREFEENLRNHKITLAQRAHEGNTSVSGFGATSPFENGRQQATEPEIVAMQASYHGKPLTLNQIDRSMEASEKGPDGIAELVNLVSKGVTGDSSSRPSAVRNSVSPSSSSIDDSGVRANQNFLASSQGGRHFRLLNSVHKPTSEWELKTGTLIPGTMISAVNSDLPGDIVGQVSQNVYDTSTGRHLLIPQGTKLFGKYDAYTALGQERILMVWDRVIFPDGESLDLSGMQSYDDQGVSGAKDIVKTRFLRTLGAALLISVVDAAGESLVNSTNDSEFVLNLQQSFGENTSSAFNAYLKSRLKIKPTLILRAGYRFNIVVSKDIEFAEPYEYGYTYLNTRR